MNNHSYKGVTQMEVKLSISQETKQKVSNLFKTLSDPTRISIIYALTEKALTVTELSQKLNMTHSAISHQLRVLRDTYLVKNTKVGKEVYYELADNHVHTIFNQAIEHVEE